MDSKQRGKQVGIAHVAKMRELFAEMVAACNGDPEVILVATGFFGRAMSLSNEDSPLTQDNRAVLRSAAIALHDEAGWSDQKIAELLGVSRSRVQGLRSSEREGARKSEQSGYRKPAPTRRPVEMDTLFDGDAA